MGFCVYMFVRRKGVKLIDKKMEVCIVEESFCCC